LIVAQEPVAADRIRVGHSERDEVASILQAAAADGRLSMEELDERLDAALRAKTFGDLHPLIEDLAADPSQGSAGLAPLPPPLSGLAHPRYQGPPPAGYSREDPLLIDGGMSSDKREGRWTVPPFIRLSLGMGTVKLNCLEATPAAQLIEVEVIGGAGTAVIVLPSGWGVDADRLTKSWGTKTIKVPRTPAAGMPVLLLHGGLGMGTFKVRPASDRELRRVARKRER
jgi:hypothetical protein